MRSGRGGTPSVKISMTVGGRAEIISEVDKWCCDNLDKFARLIGQGKRVVSKIYENKLRSKFVFC